MSAHFQRGGMEQDLSQFAILMLCDDSTSCDEMSYFYATEAETMMDIVCEVQVNKDWF